ncbi:Mismatch repair endonuclease PMS2 [Strongyloides ratti]|uniref:Mismatch repair endonuclease PMS2 n=1 Tax=Strongyloides ratti TaxID=34506 RepID=A0A090L1A0_STRRB|nr:Mismatch repair endonuclease PMS2 [Strongyloides ratti]CEF61897.1 Mismatch repair endonuclease PMS2 [Strongyloides ratti]
MSKINNRPSLCKSDAGGTTISIKLFNDGINKIQVEDNGSGIKKEDFEMVAQLHATSKIKNYEDFISLKTYGFRGEALNSLCCSSKLTILTKVKDSRGYQLEFDKNGQYLPEKTKEVSMKVGTTVIVTDLMCNFSVRRKEFIKRSGKEVQEVVKILQNYAFAKINIAFELVNIVNGKTITLMRSCGGNINIKSAISSIFSDKTKFLRNIIKLEVVDIDDDTYKIFKLDKTTSDIKKIDNVKFEGYISGLENITRNSLDYIFLSVNKRPINNTNIKNVIKAAYHRANLSYGIIFVLQIFLPSNYFDVNCSPLKDTMECSIMDLILAKIHSCIIATLEKNNPSDSCELKKRKIDEFENSPISKKKHEKPVKLINKVGKNNSQILKSKEIENDSTISNMPVSSYDSFVGKRNTVYKLFNSTMLSQVSDKTAVCDDTKQHDSLLYETNFVDETIMNSTTESKSNLKEFNENNLGESDITNRPQVVIKFSMNKLYDSAKEFSKHAFSKKNDDIHLTFGVENEKKAEEELKLHLNKKDFVNMEVIGQFNNGFIIGKLKNEIFIIDQHASDEIYNFEKLQKNRVISPQPLLQSIKVKLGAVYESAIRENINVFEKNGFRFKFSKENNSDELIELIYVPHLEGYTFDISDIEEMAVHLAEYPDTNYRPTKIRKIFASKACRRSVMAGDPLSVHKMKSILENLSKIDSPWNCPHGRPTIRQLYYQNDT